MGCGKICFLLKDQQNNSVSWWTFQKYYSNMFRYNGIINFIWWKDIHLYPVFNIFTTNLLFSDALPNTTYKGKRNKSMACVESNLPTKRHIFIPAYRSSLCYYSFEVYIKMNFYLYDNFIARRQTSTIYL